MIVESVCSLKPVEEPRVNIQLNESLIHADESSYYGWVSVGCSTALFYLGYHRLEIANNLLASHLLEFKRYLMNKGYPA